MYQEGHLLKFSSFVFKNGAKPKTKYFIVLKEIDGSVIMASLPTSKDHVPSNLMVERGCVNETERGVNAFVFNPSDNVTPTFRFPLATFVYGEQVDEYELSYLQEMVSEVEDMGVIISSLFQSLKDCIKQALLLKRKYKALL